MFRFLLLFFGERVPCTFNISFFRKVIVNQVRKTIKAVVLALKTGSRTCNDRGHIISENMLHWLVQ